MSLDAEKAFEQVNWEFSLESAQIWMVQSSYIESKCSVRINDLTSQTFNVRRATRRGCTLPSSLLGVCMEKRVKEIQNETTDHKISLHADNVLLFLWNK